MSVDDRQDSSKISSSTLEDPQEINQTLVQLGRLGEAISKEYTLVSDRMTWLVISNSFMFSAYTTAVSNYEKINQPLNILLLLVIYCIPCLAIAMCLLVLGAIHAAHSAARRLKKFRDLFESRLPVGLRIELVSSKDFEHLFGNLPPYIIPVLLGITWMFFLGFAINSLSK
jgi:hypothetical protein